VPTTTSSKSVGESFTIAVSRSFCRPRPGPIWVPKDQLRDAPFWGCYLPRATYLVDRGLRHRLPEFSSLGRLGVLPQGLRRFLYQWAHCGSYPMGRIPD
jgi:hypothetical protein